MNRVFADTFYFLAIINRRDACHGRAVQAGSQPNLQIVTTAWVLTEVVDALSQPPRRQVAIDLVRGLQSDSMVTIVDASPELFRRAIELFEAREDKSWTLTDCTSFVVMTEFGLTDSLTGDHHFAQDGFRPLLAVE
ncbi:MAG TPA: PIN domain-containing protein [Pirellulales bacterium]|nr:PIN domain-containing protein [Pirellulales bacterium]